MNVWIKCSDRMPEPFIEVLVEVDGKRGALWRNNYNLVAYMDAAGRFREERHKSNDVLPVTKWMPIPEPTEDK